MSALLTKDMFENATVVAYPEAAAVPPRGRAFDLPPALHIGMFACLFLYLGIMWATFATAELILPFAIFVVFLSASFIVPAYWAKVAPAEVKGISLSDFFHDGFVCETGRISGGAAAVQVLIMPVMLVCWGLIIAVIRASV
jgi:hypothetical protein